MTTLALKYFDTFEFVKKSKELGSSEELAAYQVKQIEQAIEVAIKNAQEEVFSKELANKKDIAESNKEIFEVRERLARTDERIIHVEKEIVEIKKEIVEIRKDIADLRCEVKNVEVRLIKWVVGTGVAAVLALAALMLKLAH